MSEAVVLGSGTSNGVPMLGYRYPHGFLENPRNHRTRASILLRGPLGNVLVDCPPEMRLQLTREGILQVSAVIITHSHADHLMGMDDLRSFCITQKQAMPVYSLPAYLDDIRRVFPYAFADFPSEIQVPRFELMEVPPILELCGMRIEVLTVMHGKLPVVALRVNDFAYVTDVSHIPNAAWRRLLGLDTLILDGVRYKPHPNHFHFDRAVEVALELGAKQTFLTHLNHDYDHDAVNASLPDQIQLAYDGLRIEV